MKTIEASTNPAVDKPLFEVFMMHSMKVFLSGSSHRIAIIAEGSIIMMKDHFHGKAFFWLC